MAGDLDELSEAAWRTKALARLLPSGSTKVGCAVRDSAGGLHVGANHQHRFRSHDIHAEVSALSAMASSGTGRAVQVFIAAERDQFTPCGSCMDWIMELGGPDCEVSFQGKQGGPVATLKASELMPYYPR
jgi:cytidine deaminase